MKNWKIKSLAAFAFLMSFIFMGCQTPNCPRSMILINNYVGGCVDYRVDDLDHPGQNVYFRDCQNLQPHFINAGNYHYKVSKDGVVYAEGTKRIACGETIVVKIFDGGATVDGNGGCTGGSTNCPCPDGGVTVPVVDSGSGAADGGVPMPDAGAVADAGISTDAGTSNDGGIATDAGTSTDAGVASDAGSSTDAGVSTDAGTSNDAGVILADGGSSSMDGGIFDDAGTGGSCNLSSTTDTPSSAACGSTVPGTASIDSAIISCNKMNDTGSTMRVESINFKFDCLDSAFNGTTRYYSSTCANSTCTLNSGATATFPGVDASCCYYVVNMSCTLTLK